MSVSKPWLPVAPSANVMKTVSSVLSLAVSETNCATEAVPVIVLAVSVSTTNVSEARFNF